MNKSQFVEKIADKAGLTEAQARRVLGIVEAALDPASNDGPATRRFIQPRPLPQEPLATTPRFSLRPPG